MLHQLDTGNNDEHTCIAESYLQLQDADNSNKVLAGGAVTCPPCAFQAARQARMSAVCGCRSAKAS